DVVAVGELGPFPEEPGKQGQADDRYRVADLRRQPGPQPAQQQEDEQKPPAAGGEQGALFLGCREAASGPGQADSSTGTDSSRSLTTSLTCRPSTSASGRTISRCPSTPRATSCTSSWVKKCRPSSTARARAHLSRFSAARGLAPRNTSGCCRLSSARLTM